MPKVVKGCYEGIRYPKALVIDGNVFNYAVSGGTRMVYFGGPDDSLAAKVMPASSSKHWRVGWDQNDVERNALETLAMRLSYTPRVIFAGDVEFVNTWGEQDVMNVLVVERLGSDLEAAKSYMTPRQYCCAYSSVFKSMQAMASCGVSVPDPHPYNCSVLAPGQLHAIPCDFGGRHCESKETHSLNERIFFPIDNLPGQRAAGDVPVFPQP
jgi:hypothetical protein